MRLFNLPNFPDLRRTKFIVHALLLTAVLTIGMKVFCDIYSITFHSRIEPKIGLIPFVMALWVLWAAQSSRYRK